MANAVETTKGHHPCERRPPQRPGQEGVPSAGEEGEHENGAAPWWSGAVSARRGGRAGSGEGDTPRPTLTASPGAVGAAVDGRLRRGTGATPRRMRRGSEGASVGSGPLPTPRSR